ncbi:MAG: RNA methyltransferase [Chloroflexota bacterium]
MRITSLQNQHIKNVVKLHQRRHRDRQGKLIIEGYRAVLRAIENGYPLETLYICPSLFFGKNEPWLIESVRKTGVQVIDVAEPAFLKMAYRQRPEGLLAVASQVRHALIEQQTESNGFYLIAESIEKPANLGSILRTADGAGVNATIVCDACTDIFNPNVVRASVGTFFSVPVWEASTAETIDWCQAQGIVTLAATPQADKLYTEVDMTKPIAIVVGTEQYGLSEQWLTCADAQIKLPMFGQVNSLNVAIAASLLLYEAVRQRREE